MNNAMTKELTKSLLWVDNAGRHRFLREIYALEDAGWRVDWALTLEQAAKALSESTFTHIVLDQSTPFRGDVLHGRVAEAAPWRWGAVVLLSWLISGNAHPDVPVGDAGDDDWEEWQSYLQHLCVANSHRSRNQGARLTIVSGYNDPAIANATKGLLGEKEVRFLSKPLRKGELQRIL